MPFDDSDIRAILGHLDRLRDTVSNLSGSVKGVEGVATRCMSDIDKLQQDVIELFRTRLSKEDFTNFKEEVFKPRLKDVEDNENEIEKVRKASEEAVTEIRNKMILWSGIGIGIQTVVTILFALWKVKHGG